MNPFLIKKDILASFKQNINFKKLILKNSSNSNYKFYYLNEDGKEQPLCPHEQTLGQIFSYIDKNVEKENSNKQLLHLKSICSQCNSTLKIKSFNLEGFNKYFKTKYIDELLYKVHNNKELFIDTNNYREVDINSFKDALMLILNKRDNLNNLNDGLNESCLEFLELMPSSIQIQMAYAISKNIIKDLTEGISYWVFFLLKISSSKYYQEYVNDRKKRAVKSVSELTELINIINLEYSLLADVCKVKGLNNDEKYWNFFFFTQGNKKCFLYSMFIYNVFSMLTSDFGLCLFSCNNHVRLGYLNYDITSKEKSEIDKKDNFYMNWIANTQSKSLSENELLVVSIPKNLKIFSSKIREKFLYIVSSLRYNESNISEIINLHTNIMKLKKTINSKKKNGGEFKNEKNRLMMIKNEQKRLESNEIKYYNALEIMESEFCFIVLEDVSGKNDELKTLPYYYSSQKETNEFFFEKILRDDRDMILYTLSNCLPESIKKITKVNDIINFKKKDFTKKKLNSLIHFENIFINSIRNLWESDKLLDFFWDILHESKKLYSISTFKEKLKEEFSKNLYFDSIIYTKIIFTLFIISYKHMIYEEKDVLNIQDIIGDLLTFLFEKKSEFIKNTQKYFFESRYFSSLDFNKRIYEFIKDSNVSPNYSFKLMNISQIF
jgi:hypothetical protein